MVGSNGNDIYYVNNSADVIDDYIGDNVIYTSVSFALTPPPVTDFPALIVKLAAVDPTSVDPINLTGNQSSQEIWGNDGNNILTGLFEFDSLFGLGGNDTLDGGELADLLDGGSGADLLIGGLNDDRYVVDQSGDVIVEAAGEGNDMVIATASYALNAGASVETMTTINANSTDPIALTGNELAQSLYGNAGDNILTGLGGADYMVGGLGNDKYYVDVSDFIAEGIGGGDDWVFVATTYTLRDGIEIETLVAVNQDSLAPVNLTGNEFGQSLYGSQGVNSLNGGAGNDYLVGLGGNDFLLGGAGNDNMAGGQGNDVYYVQDGGDQIFEAAGEGDDIAVCFASFALGAGRSVETLSANGSSGAVNLTGNELGQSLYGNGAANVLVSGGGADYMVGGAGNDTFVLTNAPGVATVGDYAAGDVVDISQYLSVANGTNVVAGGYVKIVGTQLQIDANGGGDAFVTVGNVSGSGAVTIRYQSGGSPTDLSVARSAGQESAVVAKTAIDESPTHAPLLDGWHAGSALDNSLGLDPIAPHFDLHGII